MKGNRELSLLPYFFRRAGERVGSVLKEASCHASFPGRTGLWLSLVWVAVRFVRHGVAGLRPFFFVAEVGARVEGCRVGIRVGRLFFAVQTQQVIGCCHCRRLARFFASNKREPGPCQTCCQKDKRIPLGFHCMVPLCWMSFVWDERFMIVV